MTIDTTTIVQWIGTAVAGVFSWLMYHYSHSLNSRFEQSDELVDTLNKRIDKLEDTVPQSVESLRSEIKELEDRVHTVDTKLAVVESQVRTNYEAFISRLDRLETNLPAIVEGALYRLLLKHPIGVVPKPPED